MFEADAEVLSKFCEKVLDVSKCAVEEKRRCWRFPKVTSINVSLTFQSKNSRLLLETTIFGFMRKKVGQWL
jgi:hypothetical protein